MFWSRRIFRRKILVSAKKPMIDWRESAVITTASCDVTYQCLLVN